MILWLLHLKRWVRQEFSMAKGSLDPKFTLMVALREVVVRFTEVTLICVHFALLLGLLLRCIRLFLSCLLRQCSLLHGQISSLWTNGWSRSGYLIEYKFGWIDRRFVSPWEDHHRDSAIRSVLNLALCEWDLAKWDFGDTALASIWLLTCVRFHGGCTSDPDLVDLDWSFLWWRLL